jgi:hypothetical protein
MEKNLEKDLPKEYKKFSKDRIERYNADKILPYLKEQGITKVRVEFDGSGDSGQIEQIEFLDANGEEPHGDEIADQEFVLLSENRRWEDGREIKEIFPYERTVRDFFEDAVYEALSERHCGWEINDGSFGEFQFDVNEGKLTGEVNTRTYETDSYEKEFPVGSKVRKKAKDAIKGDIEI